MAFVLVTFDNTYAKRTSSKVAKKVQTMNVEERRLMKKTSRTRAFVMISCYDAMIMNGNDVATDAFDAFDVDKRDILFRCGRTG